MRKAISFIITAVMLFLCACGQSAGITQEEYDVIVSERDELQREIDEYRNDTDRLKKTKDFFSVMDGLTFSESINGKYSALNIVSYVDINKNAKEEFEKLGEALVNANKEDWFDYDYVFIDVWSGSTGLILSIETDVKTLDTKNYEWYGESTSNEFVDSKESINRADENSIAIVGEIEVIDEYWYVNSIGSANYYLIVKNNTADTVEISVSAQAKDSDGNLIGADDEEVKAVPSGYETCVSCYFSDCENVSSFDYSISAQKDQYYEGVVQNISFEESRTDKKVIISATNNGNVPIRFCEAYALFFQSGEMVYSDSTYITDDDYELKPGATITKELNCRSGYDDVKIYFTGRE